METTETPLLDRADILLIGISDEIGPRVADLGIICVMESLSGTSRSGDDVKLAGP